MIDIGKALREVVDQVQEENRKSPSQETAPSTLFDRLRRMAKETAEEEQRKEREEERKQREAEEQAVRLREARKQAAMDQVNAAQEASRHASNEQEAARRATRELALKQAKIEQMMAELDRRLEEERQGNSHRSDEATADPQVFSSIRDRARSLVQKAGRQERVYFIKGPAGTSGGRRDVRRAMKDDKRRYREEVDRLKQGFKDDLEQLRVAFNEEMERKYGARVR